MAGNDSFTKILLHMDGSNGGTTFTDNNAGGSAHTWTAHGTTSTSTTQAKFGNASFNDGGSVSGLDYIDTPDSADFTVGSGDFTVDMWAWRAGGDGTLRFLCGQTNAAATLNSYYIFLNTDNTFYANVCSDGSTNIAVLHGTTAITTTGWNHVALVRHGTRFDLYVNGTSEANATNASGVYDSADNYAVGRLGALAADSWNGFIDEFRLSVGIARWTTTFTPPTTAYSANYSLTPAVGALTLSGQVAKQSQSRAASTGVFTLAGKTVTWPLGLNIPTGSYTLAGNVANQKQSRVASVGTYVLTGRATTRAIGFLVSVGAFVLSGISAAQKTSRLSNKGAFTLTGQVARQLQVRQVLGAAFILTGFAANLFKSQHLNCAPGAFTLTGFALNFVHLIRSGFDRIRQTNFALQKIRALAPELEE